MSLTLMPGNNFTVVRQIANHLDTDTNYVKAVIRNAYTDAIIDTLQLTDKGSQRFKKDWQVPADSSGQGFYISIVTSVYNDSGYTTKNPNYGDEENTYLIQDRILFRGGGGIDSATVRRIVSEELGKQDKPEAIDYERIPKPNEINDRTEEILQAIRDNKVTIPEMPTPVDHTQEILKAIADKPVTEIPDAKPLHDRFDRMQDDNNLTNDEIKSLLSDLESRVIEAVPGLLKQVIDETNFVTTFITHPAQKSPPKEQTPKEQPIDPKQLAL